MNEPSLPTGFEDLAPFLAWSLEEEADRVARRQASNIDEMRAFYDAMLPRMEAILAHLNQYPLAELPRDAKTLFLMALAFCEIAPAVEWYEQPQVIGGLDVRRWPLVREPARTW